MLEEKGVEATGTGLLGAWYVLDAERDGKRAIEVRLDRLGAMLNFPLILLEMGDGRGEGLVE